MYAVIQYTNCRTEQTFEMLNVFHDESKAVNKAHWYAKLKYGRSNVVEGVQRKCLYTINTIVEYTKDDGYNTGVFAVIALPEPE